MHLAQSSFYKTRYFTKKTFLSCSCSTCPWLGTNKKPRGCGAAAHVTLATADMKTAKKVSLLLLLLLVSLLSLLLLLNIAVELPPQHLQYQLQTCKQRKY